MTEDTKLKTSPPSRAAAGSVQWANDQLEQVDLLRNDVQSARDEILRKRGWTYTCKTPGSVWLWEKTLDGVTYRMSADLAEHTEREIVCNEMLVDYYKNPATHTPNVPAQRPPR